MSEEHKQLRAEQRQAGHDKRYSGSSSAAYSAYVAEANRIARAADHNVETILKDAMTGRREGEPMQQWVDEAGPYPYHQRPEHNHINIPPDRSGLAISKASGSWDQLDDLDHLTSGIGEGAAQAVHQPDRTFGSEVTLIRNSRTIEGEVVRVRRPARMRKQRPHGTQI